MDLKLLTTIKDNFVSELTRAENNEQSSLPYIRHTLPDKPLIGDSELFQVMVIGGTVFRSALCKKVNGSIKVLSKKKSHPPKFITKDDFLSYINEHLDQKINLLTLNLAYPLQPVFKSTHLDGTLLSGTKENEFLGLVGQEIGEEITKNAYKLTGKNITVTTANDAICLLLSGLSQFPKEKIFGGIIGTGVNFAYFNNQYEAINLESANFDKFPLSLEAKTIDGMSLHRGKALFEKEVSGAYLYQHYNLHHTDKLIPDTGTLAQLSQEDSTQGQEARKLFDRSASLVACQIAGILEYKKQDMIGAMEGSLFWKADNYKTLVETYISMLTKYSVRFIKVDDDSIIGGAMLAG